MEWTFKALHQVQVVVENEVGLVAISARAGDAARVTLEASTPGAEDLVAKAVVECRTSGGRDMVIVKIPRVHGMKFIRRNGVSVRIEVPPASDVQVSTASAHVELNGSLGQANVKTASGDITADEVRELRAKTASGDIEVGTVRGELRMHTAAGDLRCVRVDGPASVSSTSGDAEVGSVGDGIDVRATSGEVRLGDVCGDTSIVAVSGDVHVLSLAQGSTHIRSVSGEVEVGIARGVALSVDAETMSGTVRSDIPLTPDREAAPGHGDPAVALTVRSVSGNILVTRGVEAFVR
jgi:DUF4097 and DUF4098 domain-containing protein YvlB